MTVAYSQELIIDDDIFDAIADGARKAPTLMATAVEKRALPKIRKRLLTRLHQQPGKVVYPIAWTSEKQRRFVMAKLRRENNLPYKRTGKLVQAWKVVAVINPDGKGEIIAENPANAGRYVFGEQQQRFHRNTGWYRADDIIADESVYAENLLIETWFTVVDESAGVT